MNQFTRLHPQHRHAPRTWPPQMRIAVVVAACLIVEAIVAKNVIGGTVDIVAFLAPLWVFALSQAWPTKDRAFEIGAMLLAIAATAGVLIFYAL
jgi:dipeptide/tripeptide permease